MAAPTAPLEADRPQRAQPDQAMTAPQSRLSLEHLQKGNLLGSLKLDHVVGQENGGNKFLGKEQNAKKIRPLHRSRKLKEESDVSEPKVEELRDEKDDDGTTKADGPDAVKGDDGKADTKKDDSADKTTKDDEVTTQDETTDDGTTKKDGSFERKDAKGTSADDGKDSAETDDGSDDSDKKDDDTDSGKDDTPTKDDSQKDDSADDGSEPAGTDDTKKDDTTDDDSKPADDDTKKDDADGKDSDSKEDDEKKDDTKDDDAKKDDSSDDGSDKKGDDEKKDDSADDGSDSKDDDTKKDDSTDDDSKPADDSTDDDSKPADDDTKKDDADGKDSDTKGDEEKKDDSTDDDTKKDDSADKDGDDEKTDDPDSKPSDDKDDSDTDSKEKDDSKQDDSSDDGKDDTPKKPDPDGSFERDDSKGKTDGDSQDDDKKDEDQSPKDYSIKLLQPDLKPEKKEIIESLAQMLSNVSAACEQYQCQLNQENKVNPQSFLHEIKQDEVKFSQVYQSGSSIMISTPDEDKATELVGSSSDPELYFTGDKEDDPILMLFQAGYHIEIRDYDNLEELKSGNNNQKLALYKDSVEGEVAKISSPSFESVAWSGNPYTSKIVLTFEYQLSNDTTHFAKAIYEKTGEKDGRDQFSWKTYPLSDLKELYMNNNFSDAIGSRQKFSYQGADYYLVEKKNKDAQDVIVLADSELSPLAELPIQMPTDYAGINSFKAPSISATVAEDDNDVFAVSLTHGTNSFVYFVKYDSGNTEEDDEDEEEEEEYVRPKIERPPPEVNLTRTYINVTGAVFRFFVGLFRW